MGVVLSTLSYLRSILPAALLRTPAPYKYAALEKPRQVRLIKLRPREGSHLQCGLEIVDLDNAPPFTALSYTHGPPVARNEGDQERYDSLGLVPLICEGKEVPAKPNLVSALNQLDQLGRHGYYWIDAVCINQEDYHERGIQVSMMGDIYYAADRVVIWLGEEGPDSEYAVMFVERLLPKFEDLMKKDSGKPGVFYRSFTNSLIYDELGIDGIPKEAWEGLVDFLNRRWFFRAWTFQEALLANNIEVLCGVTKISLKRLKNLLRFLQLSEWQELSVLRDKSLEDNLNITTIPGSSLVTTMNLRELSFLKPDPGFQIYLCNIAGGDENMDIILGFIDLMIYQMRSRSATDPRDLLLSLYGVVSRFCTIADLSNPMTSPDYTKTVPQVYTENVKSLLAHSKSLLMLSNVEDRSWRRREDLPSWVPDMTVAVPQSFPRIGTGDIFSASKGAVSQILPSPNLETLSLVGYRIDTVTKVGDDGVSFGEYGGPLEKTAALLLKMPTTYITGQDRAEALWRTLIANQGTGKAYPAPGAWGKAFREHLMRHNSMFLLEAQDHGVEKYQTATNCIRPLMALAKSTPEAAALIPSLEETLYRKDIYDYITKIKKRNPAWEVGVFANPDEKPKFIETIENLLHEEANALPFSSQQTRVMLSRRVFATQGGLLGLGPQSLKAGDHIFVLPGARVPFVLRAIPPAENGSSTCHEMVGEAYIHGIMEGEALERDRQKEMNLEII
jgi:Heterokaryon incompatibility protein (HET)